MGGCQNYGPFLGPYYSTTPNIYGAQTGTLILTTTHFGIWSPTHRAQHPLVKEYGLNYIGLLIMI